MYIDNRIERKVLFNDEPEFRVQDSRAIINDGKKIFFLLVLLNNNNTYLKEKKKEQKIHTSQHELPIWQPANQKKKVI